MNQQDTIAALKAADITQDDWAYPIIAAMDSDYARGYINGRNESLTNSLDSGSEDYREALIRICGYSIWK